MPLKKVKLAFERPDQPYFGCDPTLRNIFEWQKCMVKLVIFVWIYYNLKFELSKILNEEKTQQSIFFSTKNYY